MTEASHNKPPVPDEEDLAEQRRRANDFGQDYTGPLVSEKLSTELIRDEYARSDPAFITKTENLPEQYDAWRKLRGDGSCGLRALGFGYFEVLASSHDPKVWAREKARMAQINGLLHRSGYDESIWEDWVEETDMLFDELVKADTKDAALSVLEDAFNDTVRSITILTHLRFLICFWLKEEGHRYAGYLPDMSIEEYRKSFEPTHSEMDEVSLRAGYDMLLDGSGIALEVAYLDRSSGEKVTTHAYTSADQASKHIGTMHFLYRPGHFDLLYPKRETTKQ